MTSMTASRSVDSAGARCRTALSSAGSPSCRLLGARVGRAGIDRLRRQACAALPAGRSASAADGQASRASPQPRASTSCRGARADDELAAVVAAAASAGARLRSSRCGLACAVELLDEQLAMAADHRGRDFAVASAPAASSASDDMPASSAPQPIARPCAAAIADADAGEAARADADQDAVGATGRRAARRSSAPAARHGRGRSPRRARATQAPAPSNKAAVQAAVDVSNARIMERIVVTCGAQAATPSKSDGFDRSRPRARSGGSGSRSRASA